MILRARVPREDSTHIRLPDVDPGTECAVTMLGEYLGKATVIECTDEHLEFTLDIRADADVRVTRRTKAT